METGKTKSSTGLVAKATTYSVVTKPLSFTLRSNIIMLDQILSTCKQLNRLLKRKDPYHADLVETLLNKLDKAIPSDSPKGLDKDVIIKALKDDADS